MQMSMISMVGSFQNKDTEVKNICQAKTIDRQKKVCYLIIMNGMKLYKLRKKAGFRTYASLAAKLDVTRQCVWNWEHGLNRPRVDHAVRLLEALPGLRMEDLY